uniref:NADAR domain-containing protein n=1 Tax=Strongyloides papillosus TaxID=174720 RepID=A0A0N5BG38_STREA
MDFKNVDMLSGRHKKEVSIKKEIKEEESLNERTPQRSYPLNNSLKKNSYRNRRKGFRKDSNREGKKGSRRNFSRDRRSIAKKDSRRNTKGRPRISPRRNRSPHRDRRIPRRDGDIHYNNSWDEKNDENMIVEDIPADMNSISFTISDENIIYIKHSLSIYSSVHKVPGIAFDGMNFVSVDEGYQYFKLLAFCGSTVASNFPLGKTSGDIRAFVKRTLAENGIGRKDVVRWRDERGIQIMYDLTVQKFLQNPRLLEMMIKDKDKLILNVFAEDNYDACGKKADLKKWVSEMENQVIKIPCMMNNFNIKYLPKISTGKNIQGFIVMMARKCLENSDWK